MLLLVLYGTVELSEGVEALPEGVDVGYVMGVVELVLEEMLPVEDPELLDPVLGAGVVEDSVPREVVLPDGTLPVEEPALLELMGYPGDDVLPDGVETGEVETPLELLPGGTVPDVVAPEEVEPLGVPLGVDEMLLELEPGDVVLPDGVDAGEVDGTLLDPLPGGVLPEVVEMDGVEYPPLLDDPEDEPLLDPLPEGTLPVETGDVDELLL